MTKKKVNISWSGGKDSAFALYRILLSGEYEVTGLHTVVDEGTKRVGLHGVRESLIEVQADALGLSLTKLYLKTSDNHDAYTALMRSYYNECRKAGTDGIVFGDIFLEDLKKFREELLKESRLFPVFPIWKVDTSILLQDFINAGFKTLICSANASLFGEDQLGRTLDITFLKTLNNEVDPCGENGEFHTFVYDGPIFTEPVKYSLGDIVKHDYRYKKKNEDGSVSELITSFWFQDLLPLTA